MDFDKLMQRARLTNLQRERDERVSGFATPADGGAMDLLETAMLAIEAGIRRDDWNSVAEALDMLQQCKAMVVVIGRAPRTQVVKAMRGLHKEQ